MSEQKQFKASFDEHYAYLLEHTSSQQELQQIIENANALATRLGANITIHRDCPRSGMPSAIYSILHGFRRYSLMRNRKREDSTCFGRDTKDNPNASLERNEQLSKLRAEIHDTISGIFADHATYITTSGKPKKTLAVGWSPYVYKTGKNAAENIKLVTEKIADLIFPGDEAHNEPSWRNLYDVIVLDTDETYYYPGRTVTILFVKK